MAPAFTGYKTLGRTIMTAGILASVGDVATTGWILYFVPGGEEANTVMASLMRSIGIPAVLCLRLVYGCGVSWLIGNAIAGRSPLWNRAFSHIRWSPIAVTSVAAVVALVACLIDTHNAWLLVTH